MYKVTQVVIHSDLKKLSGNNYKAKVDLMAIFRKVNEDIHQEVKIALMYELEDIKDLIDS